MPRANILTDFTVTGRGPFPFDMLRRDQCYPVSSVDATAIGTTHDELGKRSVRLRTADWSNITPGRWDSFGWTVSDIEP